MLCKTSQDLVGNKIYILENRQFITVVYCYKYYSHLLIKKFQLIHSQIKGAALI